LVLATVGTINREKNPINFLTALIGTRLVDKKEFVEYRIIGKCFGEIGSHILDIVRGKGGIYFYDSYISHEAFSSLMAEVDIIVIPYDADYTKYMTSGVMWDCFSYGVPMLCPDVPLFRYYIEKYGVGYIYDQQTDLRELILMIKNDRPKMVAMCSEGFRKMSRDFSFESNASRLHDAFEFRTA
jgi:glycosyltransferase involved in cell wall biosynthesis